MTVWRSPRAGDASNAPTLTAPSFHRTGGAAASGAPVGTDPDDTNEERVAAQIRFRRAFTVGYAVWLSFTLVDWAMVRYLDAGRLTYFLALRAAVAVVVAPVLVRLHRGPPPSMRALRRMDLVGYTAPAVAIALMCVEFRGIASPYAPGICLVLLARIVIAQEPWRRGLARTAVPVCASFAVLVGAGLVSSRIAAQLQDAAAITTFLLNSAYILGTYVFLVVSGHVVWSLRRQIFEARALGRYRLKHRLASGGMGDVWVGHHPGLKQDVAVKILRQEVARSPSAITRFEREVRATSELRHPNTVRVFDCGATEDGLWYYVMELLEGETLAAHVERLGPQPPARAVHLVGQAARALAEAHDHGIVHRDVKPENLFLTSLGGEHDFVKVIDFGIARMDDVDAAMTRTGSVMGTPAYMSPEVALGRRADARADVYGLGAVLYFLLCGRPPFDASNAQAMFVAHVSAEVTPPSKRLGQLLPPDVEAVVIRALSKDPAQRYANGAELALALSACDVAGRWTFGDATVVARRSSRPPPPGGVDVLVNLRPPRAPTFGELPGAAPPVAAPPLAPLRKVTPS